jgi:predicted transcriptional regulator
MIDGESLVQRMLSSDAKADLLTLFRGNPGLMDGIDGVARRIGRSPKSIKAEVDDLLDLGVLGKKQAGKTVVLYLQRERDAQIQETIAAYLSTPGLVSL